MNNCVKLSFGLGLLSFVFASGCVSEAPRPNVNWLLSADALTATAAPQAGTVRVAPITVRAPYDRQAIVVRRAGDTVAFDPFNSFASSPSQLLRQAAEDWLASVGTFGAVIPSGSVAPADRTFEITVRELSYDCRNDNAASVALSVRVLSNRQVEKTVSASARVCVTDGDFGKAFSSAFVQALEQVK